MNKKLLNLRDRALARKKECSMKPQDDNCIKVINNNYKDLEAEVYNNINRF